MSLVVPNSRELEVLTTILTPALTMKLYGNNKVPDDGDSTGNYTEIAGGGYASKALTFANWTIATVDDVARGTYNTVQEWTFSGTINAPGTIYGYFVIRNSDSALMWAERFGAGVVPFSPIAGSVIRVLPRYTVTSQF